MGATWSLRRGAPTQALRLPPGISLEGREKLLSSRVELRNVVATGGLATQDSVRETTRSTGAVTRGFKRARDTSTGSRSRQKRQQSTVGHTRCRGTPKTSLLQSYWLLEPLAAPMDVTQWWTVCGKLCHILGTFISPRASRSSALSQAYDQRGVVDELTTRTSSALLTHSRQQSCCPLGDVDLHLSPQPRHSGTRSSNGRIRLLQE